MIKILVSTYNSQPEALKNNPLLGEESLRLQLKFDMELWGAQTEENYMKSYKVEHQVNDLINKYKYKHKIKTVETLLNYAVKPNVMANNFRSIGFIIVLIF